ncbi:DddA-like double-stranded DNA deaminase toxin [Amycolatopsis samaneae]|uniref:DddA-like double-stranded DNA deaminase toxin n=1 Tax=Amycolatopsis samaneae TaxID=664691 RepID=A0ABW5GSL0_9PSEU
MTDVEELVALVGAALDAMNRAAAALEQARDQVKTVGETWAQAWQGRRSQEAIEAEGGAESVRADTDALAARLRAATADLTSYRDNLTGSPTPPAAPPGPATSRSALPLPTHGTQEPERVKAARAQLPPSVTPNTGQKTHGRWFAGNSDESISVTSGQDEQYEQAKAHLATLGIPNVIASSHAETKLAVTMVAKGLTDVTMTINNMPCRGRWSCDRLIPAILPHGSTMTIHGTKPDGTPTVNHYAGKANR